MHCSCCNWCVFSMNSLTVCIDSYMINLPTSSLKMQVCPKGRAAVTHQFNWLKSDIKRTPISWHWRKSNKPNSRETQWKGPALQRWCCILVSWGNSPHSLQQHGLSVKCCNIQYFFPYCFKLGKFNVSLENYLKSEEGFSSCAAAS